MTKRRIVWARVAAGKRCGRCGHVGQPGPDRACPVAGGNTHSFQGRFQRAGTPGSVRDAPGRGYWVAATVKVREPVALLAEAVVKRKAYSVFA